jgi:adenylate cyclase
MEDRVAYEIERKFLVTGDGWHRAVVARRHLRQFYLATGDGASIRVRIADRTHAWLTVKSAEAGARRSEFEYEIPVADADDMQSLAVGRIITKVRHIVPADDLRWEIDVFEGDHAGLVIAEIELRTMDQTFGRPDWLGAEVTHDRRYYNAALALRPLDET